MMNLTCKCRGYIFGMMALCGALATGQQVDQDFPEIPPSVLPLARMDWKDAQDPMASRLFRTSSVRTQIQLGGLWDFLTDRKNQGESRRYFAEFPESETSIWIPGTWNVMPRYWQYEGVAWCRRSFSTGQDGRLRIRFGGIFYHAKVWLDGRLLGGHEGGYSPFALLARDVKKGEHTLTVRIDNSLNDETLPKSGVDWFPYGGIIRPAYAELVNDVFIDCFHVIPSKITSDRVNLSVRAFVKNISGRGMELPFTFEVNGQRLFTETRRVGTGDSVAEFITPLKNPRLWSPADPFLYSARISIGNEADDQFTRFGIRTFAAEGNKIVLNGERFKLMGANHHDDHPDWGSALPPQVIRQDIEILRRMGANAVRVHYPPDEMLVDYCDQNGLVLMNEVPSWQYGPEQLASRAIQEKIKQQFSEMVYRDMSHPSIFSWSLGNEWPKFEKSYDVIKSLVEYARTVDQTHFVTFITGGAEIGRACELIDIICTNWAQYQWYDPTTYLDRTEGEKSIAVLNRIRQRFPQKPLILTEFGGAESQAGWHNWGNAKWSEEYQARNVRDSAQYALEQEWISGGCVWQFCETRTSPLRMLTARLRGWNGKGVLDSYRSPKMAFYELQELFHSYGAGRVNSAYIR